MWQDSKYNLFHIHDVFNIYIDIYRYSTIGLKYIFFQLKLHLDSHDIRFANVFDSFIPVIMLNALRFISSVLFGIHTLDKSLRVLQLPTHLSDLTVNA